MSGIQNHVFTAICAYVQLQRLCFMDVLKNCYQVQRNLFNGVVAEFVRFFVYPVRNTLILNSITLSMRKFYISNNLLILIKTIIARTALGHGIPRGKMILTLFIVVIFGVACTSHRITGDRIDTHISSANNGTSPVAESATNPIKKSLTEQVLYHLLVAELAGQRDRIPTAVSNYLDAAIGSRDTTIAQRATHIALLAGDREQGLQAAKLWTRLDPNALEAKRAYATFLVRGGHMDEAVPVLRGLMNHPDSPPDQGLLTVAGLLSQGKDREVALAAMERIVAEYVAEHSDKSRAEPVASFALAHFLFRIEKVDRAIDLLEEVIAADKKNPTAHIYYAQALRNRGQTAKALDVLSEALANGVDDEDIRINLARLSIAEKRYETAREQLERLLAIDPNDAEIRYTLALLLLQTGRPNKAHKHLRYLTNQENLTQETYFNLGQLAESQKNLRMAMDAYRKVAYGQHYLNAQLRIAALLAKQGNLRGARAHLHGILPKSGEDAIRLYQMDGLILTDAGHLEAAMSVYDAALESHPKDNDLLYARAMLAGRMGQVSRLERDLRELLSRKPDHVDALNALGYTLADKTDRYQEAMAMIRRALRLQPENYYILDSMGWVLYRLGRHQESIGYLQRALAIQQDPEVAAHLGEVLWVTGEHKAARKVWDAALETAPDDALLLEVMERFGE